jgi:hypothetical protein
MRWAMGQAASGGGEGDVAAYGLKLLQVAAGSAVAVGVPDVVVRAAVAVAGGRGC